MRRRSTIFSLPGLIILVVLLAGLVGPYMVLLHSSWKFNGLAGIVMLMAGIVVISGFIGRYIYTAIPRNVDGLEMEAGMRKSRSKPWNSI